MGYANAPSTPPSVMPPPETAPADAIVVRGTTRAVVRNYVDKIAKPELGRQIARWNGPICIGVDGIPDKFGSYIRGRITDIAHALRLLVLAPGCPANVVILLSDHANPVAKAMVEARPKRVGNINSNVLLPPGTVAALEAPRTIRWMTASETVGDDGMPIGATNQVLAASSLIRTYAREDAVAKTIIIDQSRLAGITLAQLADYIAFVAVSTPDIAADYSGVDSILALFAKNDGAPKPTGLTASDMRFLHALYTATADRSAAQEKGAIRQTLDSHKRGDGANQATRPLP